MKSQNVVEFADRISRKRALGTAVATGVFLMLQLVARPVFRSDSWASGWRAYAWVLNAALLLLLLLPIGGFVWGRRVRTLVNDDVSREHARTAAAAGFWVAVVIALVLYALPAAQSLSGREAAYLVVTPTTGVALLAFAWLESRAHRDG